MKDGIFPVIDDQEGGGGRQVASLLPDKPRGLGPVDKFTHPQAD